MQNTPSSSPKYSEPSAIVSIGDLHGRHSNLTDTIVDSGYATEWSDGSLTWIGWPNVQIVFQGDILGDRNEEWLKIFRAIQSLRSQWANIVTLAWNHEEFFTGFLTGKPIQYSQGNIGRLSEAVHQNKWLRELRPHLQIGTSTASNLSNIQDIISLTEPGEELIQMLETLQLAHIEPRSGILFFHTPPTEQMISLLLKQAKSIQSLQSMICSTNNFWQEGMKAHILHQELEQNFYEKLSGIFLSTANSNYNRGWSWGPKLMTEEQAQQLHSIGIRRIVHGHEEVDPKTIGGIRVESTDTTYGKSAEWDTQGHSLPMKIYAISDRVKSGTDSLLRAAETVMDEPEWYTFEDVSNWDDLYHRLLDIWEIQGSQKLYVARELYSDIRGVQSGKLDISKITRALGLRDCVERLIAQGT